jgi:protein involved in polysaccharide export with SLBB domain
LERYLLPLPAHGLRSQLNAETGPAGSSVRLLIRNSTQIGRSNWNLQPRPPFEGGKFPIGLNFKVFNMTFSYVDLSRVAFLIVALGWADVSWADDRSGGSAGLPAKSDATSASASEDAFPTAVTDAQKVTLKFSDIPRLNGDYRVNADETVTIPGLGRVAVGDITVSQLEEILSERATAIAGRDVYVTVEVSEYRPVFISGNVSRFGPLPWQPGLTVEQALASVGGIVQSQVGDAVIQRRRAELDEQRLIAAMARLKAEQQGAERIEVPAELIKLSGKSEAEKLIQAQLTLMHNRRISLQKQLDSLAVGKNLGYQELEALRVQRSRLEEQLQLRRNQREKIQSLLDKKLTVADRALEENIKVSDLEEKSANISVAIARVQATITNFEREALNLAEARKSEVDTEIIRLERELAQTRAVLDVIKDPDQEEEPSTRYFISRRGKGSALKVMEAERSSSLMPGDLLSVQVASSQR